ncbi:epididymal-specific lipocalin-6 isoform X2 [Bos javanicus]|uniref:epididymal-specific lipocalin-6 isoform X2 n=1 Tax=Bos javanicus TaxID=9906 RepID=UPI002AA6B14A|nr:epididymal-specific lipocalin-6 isoform X2 [Bos javanicus]
MRAALLAALLAVVLVPSARAVWLGRLDPQQLMGSWYVLAVASGEKDFALEKATKSVEGVEVMLTSQNTLKMRASRHRLERCHLQAVELRRQNSRWVFANPSRGVLEYRVLGTNFRDYAIVFTQLEAQEEAFSTVELYSRTPLASQEALGRFAKWSRSLGLLSQQQAELQRDFTCAHKVFPFSGFWSRGCQTHSVILRRDRKKPVFRNTLRGVEGFRVMVPDYSASVVYLRLGRAGRTTRTLLLFSRQPTCSFLSMKKFVNACEALGLASRAAVLPKDGLPENAGGWGRVPAGRWGPGPLSFALCRARGPRGAAARARQTWDPSETPSPFLPLQPPARTPSCREPAAHLLLPVRLGLWSSQTLGASSRLQASHPTAC